MKKLRVLEFFSGIGATHVAFDMLREQLDVDFEFVDAIEIDPVPMAMYNSMFGTNHPTQDVTKWDKSIEELDGEIDIIQHSSPCFVAGTLVLTSRGYIPIEDVQVGDLVFTHKNRWKKVLRTGSKESETYVLKGDSGSVQIETTANHPFYALESVDSDYSWTRADEMKNKYFSVINSILSFNDIVVPDCDVESLFLAGAWLSESDSSFSSDENNYQEWIVNNFSLDGKCFIPVWIHFLSDELKNSFLKGFLQSYYDLGKFEYTSKKETFVIENKSILFNLRLLFESLGYRTIVKPFLNKLIVFNKGYCPKHTLIDNLNHFSLYCCTNGKYTGEVKTVYNLEVEDDNSYIADSIIVHNCQDFSNQGHGAGAEKDSGTRSSLLWEMVRICDKIRPKIMIWENVEGLLNHKHAAVFEGYKEELRCMGYLSYVIKMNASDYGIPQARPRVFTVSVRKDFSDKYFYQPDPFYNNICLRDLLEDEPKDFKFHWYDLGGKQFLKDKEDNYFKNVKLESQLYYKGINPEYNIYPGIYVLAEVDQAFKSTSRIFSPDGISPTLDTKSEVKVGLKEDLYEDRAIRYITPLEAWRIDGFPDDYYFKATQACHAATKLKKAAGNSISTAQMYHLLKEIIIHLFGEDYYNRDRLEDSIYYLPYFEGKGIYKNNE